MKTKIKYVVFSLLPVTILLLLLEMGVRLLDLAHPQYVTAPLPDEFRGLIEPHEELFWVLKPGARSVEPNGVPVRINSHGLRGGDLPDKAANEFRILSLGESTTFGANVAEEDTYSARLEDFINAAAPVDRVVRVINAGVSAYSSFQGLKYLELYGLDLQPDLVLIYFEVNDYLPSTLRSYGFDETSSYLSDAALHRTRTHSLTRDVIRRSKLLTLLHYRYAAYKMRRMSRQDLPNPLSQIALHRPDLLANRLATEREGQVTRTTFNESHLGQRVSEVERSEILASFQARCTQEGVPLVVIHPSYRDSQPHTCVLTHFCQSQAIPLLDAFGSLHPDSLDAGALFLDELHPNREGHRRLAKDLASFLRPYVHDPE